MNRFVKLINDPSNGEVITLGGLAAAVRELQATMPDDSILARVFNPTFLRDEIGIEVPVDVKTLSVDELLSEYRLGPRGSNDAALQEILERARTVEVQR